MTTLTSPYSICFQLHTNETSDTEFYIDVKCSPCCAFARILIHIVEKNLQLVLKYINISKAPYMFAGFTEIIHKYIYLKIWIKTFKNKSSLPVIRE